MHSAFRFAKTAYIGSQNLKPFLTDYTNPDDFLSRKVKEGEILRLKNGFFLISETIERTPIPYEQIANLLYGPSYISLEWALSYYGMIPEGVYVVTSVSATKSKSFKTQVGTFDYSYLSHQRYAIGISQRDNENGHFIIATPEKALADVIHFKSAKLNPAELLLDLIEARRIDENSLKQLNKLHLLEIAENYRSKTVNNLYRALEKL